MWLAWRRLWCTWIDDKRTVATNHPRGALPGVRRNVSLLLSHRSFSMPQRSLKNQPLIIFCSNSKRQQKCAFRWGSACCAAYLPATWAQCYYQPAHCQLAPILVPFKIASLPKLTICVQPLPHAYTAPLSNVPRCSVSSLQPSSLQPNRIHLMVAVTFCRALLSD